MEARGTVKLKLQGDLPKGTSQITIPRGARMSSPGGHHVATDETVIFTASTKEHETPVVAFYPGPSHNLNPAIPDAGGGFSQKLDRWNRLDPVVQELDNAEKNASANLVVIEHTKPLTGGDGQWPDARYRELLLKAPRSIWTIQAIETAVALVPGVRQVTIRDPLGGLDINQSIFGNFNFIERLFGTERDLATPYYFTVLVAPMLAAIWEGTSGLKADIENTIENLRPIGIFPQITQAEQIGIGVRGNLVVDGLPLPTGTRAVVNGSAAAVALKQRLMTRIGRYVDALRFGEPVRYSEVVWAIMSEPGIADVQDLRLLQYPPAFDSMNFNNTITENSQVYALGENVKTQSNQIAVFVDDLSGLQIV